MFKLVIVIYIHLFLFCIIIKSSSHPIWLLSDILARHKENQHSQQMAAPQVETGHNLVYRNCMLEYLSVSVLVMMGVFLF
jgi:hypothetical protein